MVGRDLWWDVTWRRAYQLWNYIYNSEDLYVAGIIGGIYMVGGEQQDQGESKFSKQ